jgi:prophage DNA circulation protein
MTADFDALSEASYEGVTFPLADAPVEGGNDFAEHTAYRRSGSDMEPTGWRAYSGSLTIPCINTAGLVRRYGKLWPDLSGDLIATFKAKPRGQLVHPLLGTLLVAITDVSQSGDVGVRNGVTLTVKWKEHNASLALLIGTDGALTTSPTTTVTTRATEADAAGVGIVGYTPMASTVDDQATFLESAPRTYSEVQGAFRVMLAPLYANLALPAVQALDGYAALVALLSLRATLYSYRAGFLPGDASIRYYTVPVPTSVAAVSMAVYGNLDGMTLLQSANTFLDPLNIAPGRILTILPAT